MLAYNLLVPRVSCTEIGCVWRQIWMQRMLACDGGSCSAPLLMGMAACIDFDICVLIHHAVTSFTSIYLASITGYEGSHKSAKVALPPHYHQQHLQWRGQGTYEYRTSDNVAA